MGIGNFPLGGIFGAAGLGQDQRSQQLQNQFAALTFTHSGTASDNVFYAPSVPTRKVKVPPPPEVPERSWLDSRVDEITERGRKLLA